MKQIIVMRKDLGMRKGKMVAQGAHASMKAVVENFNDERVKAWLGMRFAKICVGVDSDEELRSIVDGARNAGLITALIEDSGKTEFHDVVTTTCAAIGPDLPERIDPITGTLGLL